jgi:hypothetical protein
LLIKNGKEYHGKFTWVRAAGRAIPERKPRRKVADGNSLKTAR